MSADCIFCKIIGSELPCTKVYEDDQVLAFMDINPVTKGHALVIPKQHCNPITGTPDNVLRKLIVVVKKIVAAQVAGLKASGVNVTQANGVSAGQIVPHIHFHVIPRYDTDKHDWSTPQRKYDSAKEMKEYADRIASALD